MSPQHAPPAFCAEWDQELGAERQTNLNLAGLSTSCQLVQKIIPFPFRRQATGQKRGYIYNANPPLGRGISPPLSLASTSLSWEAGAGTSSERGEGTPAIRDLGICEELRYPPTPSYSRRSTAWSAAEAPGEQERFFLLIGRRRSTGAWSPFQENQHTIDFSDRGYAHGNWCRKTKKRACMRTHTLGNRHLKTRTYIFGRLPTKAKKNLAPGYRRESLTLAVLLLF